MMGFNPEVALRRLFTEVQQAAQEVAQERNWDDQTHLYSARQVYGLLAKGVLLTCRKLRIPEPPLNEVTRTSLSLAEYPMLSTSAGVSARLKEKGVLPRDAGTTRKRDGSLQEDMAERVKDAPIREAMGLLPFRVDSGPNLRDPSPRGEAPGSASAEHDEVTRNAEKAVAEAMSEEASLGPEHDAIVERARKARAEGKRLTPREEAAMLADSQSVARLMNRASHLTPGLTPNIRYVATPDGIVGLCSPPAQETAATGSTREPPPDYTVEGMAAQVAADGRQGMIFAAIALVLLGIYWLMS